MLLDVSKLSCVVAQFTEDHVMFVLNKYRTFLLKQRYSDIKKPIPESNYQTICLDLENDIHSTFCGSANYLQSKTKVPFLMKIGNPRVYSSNYFQGEITYVSRDRMRYVGYNKFLQNIIYCSIGPDNYLYFKSFNPQYLYLEKVKFTGIFQDSMQASDLQCPDDNGETVCNPVDRTFPIEDALVPPLIELVVKELAGPVYKPDDEANNAKDDLVNKLVGK